jgi:hypothetical protein
MNIRRALLLAAGLVGLIVAFALSWAFCRACLGEATGRQSPRLSGAAGKRDGVTGDPGEETGTHSNGCRVIQPR